MRRGVLFEAFRRRAADAVANVIFPLREGNERLELVDRERYCSVR